MLPREYGRIQVVFAFALVFTLFLRTLEPCRGIPFKMDRPAVNDLVQQNIDTIARIEQAANDSMSNADRVANTVSGFVGRMAFVWVQCAVLVLWFVINGSSVFPKSMQFDPFPHHILILTLAIEAILLSTFILISQNREQLIANKRNHLDLQINLLAEQEASQMLTMLQQIMQHLKIDADHDEIDALRKAADPEQMADQIEESMNLSVKEDL